MSFLSPAIPRAGVWEELNPGSSLVK